MGIEPATTRCLVVVLTTKLLGPEAEFWDVKKKKNTLHHAPVVQGPLGSGWIAVLGMDGRLLLARSGRV